MFLQAIYTSQSTADVGDAELSAILAVSIKNNQRSDVTGLLIFNQGTFMQVLEGSSAAVDATLHRIKRDSRHTKFNLLVRNISKTREFSRWDMAIRHICAADTEALPALAPFFAQGFDAATIGAKPGLCMDLMKALIGLGGADLAQDAVP